MKKLLLSFLIVLFCSSIAGAACVADGANWATTPDLTSVASCVTQADAGDTITVSAGDGTETWASTLTISKGINLIGPGAGSLTVTSSSNPAISYSPSVGATDNTFRLSGFTFKSGSTNTLLYFGNINNAPSAEGNNKLTKNRVDNCVFTQDTLGADTQSNVPLIWMFPGTYGVIDSNTFNAHQYAFRATSNTTGLNGWLYWGWSAGTSDAIYVENNTFNYAYTGNQGIVGTSSQSPHRWVFRYNTFNISSNGSSYSFFDAHGNNAGDYTAVQISNLYGNKFVAGSKTGQMHGIRGGQAFVFYNDWQTTGSTPTIKVQEEYDDASFGGATNAITGQPQHIYNSFFWNNRKSTTGALLTTYVAGTLSGIPAVNVDFFNQTNWSADGSAGVGCGTLVNRPGICTTGVGYWATDQSCSDLTDYVGASPTTPISGTLYKCTATNTWTAYYTPYTYPHPLRGESDTTAPTNNQAGNSINSAGTQLTMNYSESLVKTGDGTLSLSCTGGAITPTYSSGSGTANHVYSLSRTVNQGEVCTVSYTQSGNDLEDIAGNDLATYSDHTIVNGSTQQTETTYALSLTVVGGGVVNSSQGGIQCTAATSPCSKTCDDGTVITFTPIEYDGWKASPTWSGTGCGTTTTMSEARTCTVTFTEIKLFN